MIDPVSDGEEAGELSAGPFASIKLTDGRVCFRGAGFEAGFI
jgi:hypothetical protein